MEQESTTKFCKDCKHCNRHWLFGYMFAKCRAHITSHIDLVSGEKKTTFEETYCEVQRKYEHCCGPTAKLFKEKEKGWWK